jgi:hypothetical protein
MKQTIMMLDKSGLRKKSEMKVVAPVIKDERPQSQILKEQYDSEIQNIWKMMRQNLITQDEAAQMIRKVMEKKNNK